MFSLSKKQGFSSIEAAEAALKQVSPRQVRWLGLTHTDIEPYTGRFAQFERLEGLSLAWCQGGPQLPEDIRTLRHLRYLTVLNVPLQLFPDWIGELTNLRRLIFRGTDVRAISPHIRCCTRLRSINLGNNLIEQVPLELGQLLQLRHLDIPCNPLTFFPAEILALPKLRGLGLAGTCFCEAEVKFIQDRFPHATVWFISNEVKAHCRH